MMSRRFLKIQTVFFLFIAGCSTAPVSEEAITKPNQNERSISVLNNLIQVDVDAYHTYNQAIQASSLPNNINMLKAFRNEHDEHIKVMSKMVIAKGGTPTQFSKDFKGYVISGYTAVKVKGGTHSILQAMETNEGLTIKYHNDALKVDLPNDVRSVIQTHLNSAETRLISIKRMKAQVQAF